MRGRSPSTSRPAAGLAREAALYFRLAGATSAAEDQSSVHALADGLDWRAFRAIARREGTTAAVWRRLQAADVDLPADDIAAFAREAQVLDFHRLRLERALADALRLLATAGLRVVLLKGAALTRVAYARPTERPMSDADVLLAPAEAAEAGRVLRRAGWRDATEDPDAAGGRYARHHHLPPLLAPDGSGALLELHRDVLPPGHPFAWDGRAVLARAVEAPRCPAALVPDAPDLLLHACIHFAWAHELRHGAWRTFADVAALLGAHAPNGSPLVDLDLFAARAGAARAASAAGWTLHLARELAGAPLPAGAVRLVPRGLGARSLTATLAAELAPGGEGMPSVAAARIAWEGALRPRRSGHGTARPWRVGAGGTAAGKRPRPLTPRALAQLRRLGRWARWTGRVLRG